MRLPGLVRYLCALRACVRVCARARAYVSVYEREREKLRYEGGSMYVCVWMCGRL